MRKLMRFTLGFGALCVFESFWYMPEVLPVAGIVCLCISCLCLLKRDNRLLRILSAVLLGFSLGCGWFFGFDRLYLADVRSLDANTVDFEICVSDYSWETSAGTGADGILKWNGKTYKTTLYLNTPQALMPGDRVSGAFQVRFTASGGQSEPNSFRGEGTFLVLYQRGDISVQSAEELPWYGYPAHWRQKLLQALSDTLAEDVEGFAQALLLGNRDKLDHKTQTALKISGIQHIVAVSGLHVSILCGLIYILTLRKRALTFLVGVPSLILFAAVVGFTPSVTRACIMMCLMLLAQLIDREYDPPTELAFSVLVMLVANPLTVTSVSFQLSVACMVGIFLFSGRIKAWLSSKERLGSLAGKGIKSRLKRWFANSVSITLGATVMTTPLVAYYFGNVSLVSVFTNLLTLWAVTLIFYGLTAVCILSFVSMGLASLLGSGIEWLIRYVLAVAKLFSALPFAAVYTESIYTVIWLTGSYLLLAVHLLIKRKRTKLFSGCVTVILLLCVVASWTEPLLFDCYTTVLDVGQGQCIILQSRGTTFVVDCGGDHSESAADLAADTLLSRGISRIDGLILTHYDADHAGGAEFLLDRIRADTLLLPDIADDNGVARKLSQKHDGQTICVAEDMEISFGSGKLQIFGPVAYDSGNESGLCVLFQTEKCDILITGDRDQLGEMLLLHQTKLPKIELLVAGHHGAASSTTEELLSEVMPDTVVISVGKNNRYGHPALSVLDRLHKFGCGVFRTDLDGTIIYRR